MRGTGIWNAHVRSNVRQRTRLDIDVQQQTSTGRDKLVPPKSDDHILQDADSNLHTEMIQEANSWER